MPTQRSAETADVDVEEQYTEPRAVAGGVQ